MAEPETPSLLELLRAFPDRVTSALSKVEIRRALFRRQAMPAEKRRAGDVLSRVALLRIDDPILDRAGALEPAELRSLDAVHLATALSLAEDLGAFASYDARLNAAASRLRLPVVTPGR